MTDNMKRYIFVWKGFDDKRHIVFAETMLGAECLLRKKLKHPLGPPEFYDVQIDNPINVEEISGT